MPHKNYVEIAKEKARENYLETYAGETIVAPDMIGVSRTDTPHGLLQCSVCKFPGRDQHGNSNSFYGFILSDERVEEMELDRRGLGRPKDDNSVAEWARLHIVPAVSKPDEALSSRLLYARYLEWARTQKGAEIYGIVKFTRLLTEKCDVKFIRRNKGKVAPWVILRQAS